MGRAAWIVMSLAAGCGTDGSSTPRSDPSPVHVSARANENAQVAPGEGHSQGAAIYQEVCSTCHEIGKTPDTSLVVEAVCCSVAPFAVATTDEDDDPTAVRPVSFRDPGYWVHEPTDAYLTEVIRKGGAGTGLSPLMPAMGERYDDAQIAAVVEYIRSLRPRS